MDEDEATYLMNQAKRCRRLASALGDNHAQHTLVQMADDYEARARQIIKQRSQPPPQT